MQRLLTMNGLVSGDAMRDLLEAFPELQDSFEQRKTYDEYRFTDTNVELTEEIIVNLTQAQYILTISQETVNIE